MRRSAVNQEEFEAKVVERAGVPPRLAEDLIRATLRTLSERLTRGEADDLAAQLPKGIKGWLSGSSEPFAERFGLDEFVRRVAKRANMPPDEAKVGTEAVFTTLQEAVSGGEFKDVMSQLPDEFRELVRA
jgi:uncharacterized protein (DUF2267 family)